METQTESKAKPKKQNSTIKFEGSDYKLLAQLTDKANKKSFGRILKNRDILLLGLSKITDEDIKFLQDTSKSEKDYIHERHDKWMKQNGKIDKNEFIAKIMRGEIKLN